MPRKKVDKAPRDEYPESELVQKGLPCGMCGGSDCLALYSDGHTYCFSQCRQAFPPQHANSTAVSGELLGGDPVVVRGGHPAGDSSALAQVLAASKVIPLRTRGITQATCEVWNYRVAQRKSDGAWEQLAPYHAPNGQLVGIKFRDDEKAFRVEGDIKNVLFGAQKWPKGGKRIVVVGGEIDALTLSQMYGHKWPVVSPPLGESAAAKCIQANLEYLLSFDEVVFGFDNDPVGQQANLDCAKLMPPGRARIVKWTLKDPNEMLMKGLGESITLCVFSAEKYQPGGILDARHVDIMEEPEEGRPWPWKCMTRWTYGRRYGETYVWGAGFGIGKTDAFAEIIAATLKGETLDGHAPAFAPEPWGLFAFEGGGPKALKERIAGKLFGKRFHLPANADYPEWTNAEKAAAQDYMDGELWDRGGHLHLNDHKGQSDWESIKERIRYLAMAEGVRNFLMDPISAMTAGHEDERSDIDGMIREFTLLMGELKATGYLASHLSRPKEGPTHEEGGQVRGGQFRGSNAIGMFTDFVFGWERNTQEPGSATTLRVVKDRLSGNFTGQTALFGYDQISGRLEEAVPKFTGDV